MSWNNVCISMVLLIFCAHDVLSFSDATNEKMQNTGTEQTTMSPTTSHTVGDTLLMLRVIADSYSYDFSSTEQTTMSPTTSHTGTTLLTPPVIDDSYSYDFSESFSPTMMLTDAVYDFFSPTTSNPTEVAISTWLPSISPTGAAQSTDLHTTGPSGVSNSPSSPTFTPSGTSQFMDLHTMGLSDVSNSPSSPTFNPTADSTYTASFTIALEGVNPSSLTETVLKSTKNGMASLLGFLPMQVSVSVMSRRKASGLGRVLSSSATMNIEISGLGSSEISTIQNDVSTVTSDGSLMSVFTSAGLPVASLSVSEIQITSSGSFEPSLQPFPSPTDHLSEQNEFFDSDSNDLEEVSQGKSEITSIDKVWMIVAGVCFSVAICGLMVLRCWNIKRHQQVEFSQIDPRLTKVYIL